MVKGVISFFSKFLSMMSQEFLRALRDTYVVTNFRENSTFFARMKKSKSTVSRNHLIMELACLVSLFFAMNQKLSRS